MPDTGISADAPPRMEELLDIAARLFNAKGFRATSLAEIGDALGMNKASLYYYVRSKDDLLARVIYRASQRLRDLAETVSRDADDPARSLKQLIENHCRTILDHPDEFGTVIFQRRHISETISSEISGRERVYADTLKNLVEKGIDTGAFRPMDTSVVTQTILDAVNGILRWYRPDGRLSRDDAIAEVVAFVDAAVSK
jgi:AcrR family transcriptional regulator